MTIYVTDHTTATLVPETTGPIADSGHDDVSINDLTVVERDDAWSVFFDTTEFVRFQATVAQPIKQPYIHDGEVLTFQKDEAELKQAQPMIQSLPWTMGHPPKDRVTSAEQIRGFWDNPEYTDGQDAELYLPRSDEKAINFALDNPSVSVGFAADLDWETTDNTVDAVQRNMAYDHIASVKQGRCSPEQGCGLHTGTDVASSRGEDAATAVSSETADLNGAFGDIAPDAHGHVQAASTDDQLHTDAVRTMETEEQQYGGNDEEHGEMEPAYEEGEWLRWEWSGGSARGRVTNVSTSEPLMASGTERDPSEQGEPVYKLEHWDSEAESFGNMKVAYESNLSAAEAPEDFSDSAHGEEENDGEHDFDIEKHQYDTVEQALEAASDIGCAGFHAHETDDGTVYMPCETMAAFEESIGQDITDSLEDEAVTSCGCLGTVDDSKDNARFIVRESRHGVGPCTEGDCSCGMHVRGDATIEGTEIDLTVPEGAQSAAEAFLQAKDDGLIPDSCGTGVGTTSAEMIATGEVTAERLEAKIAPYLVSHEADTTTEQHPAQWPTGEGEDTETPWSDCGDAMYAAWGWHSLLEWAKRKADQIKRARGEDPVYSDDSMNDNLDEYTDATTIEDTIRYEDTMGGDLDESALPSEGYEMHYVFDADTKSDSSFPLVDAEGNLRRGNVKSAFDLRGHADDETLLMNVLRKANSAFDDEPIDDDNITDNLNDSEMNADNSPENSITDGESLASTLRSEIESSEMEMSDARDQMASTAGIEPGTVSKILDAEITCPPMERLEGFADALNVATDDLVAAANEDGCEYDQNMTDSPSDFYDGEPDAETLADDFDAVDLLLEEKEKLTDERDELAEELEAYERDAFADKAERLAELTDKWGDVEDITEKFDADEWSVDDIDEKIELVEDLKTDSATTVGSSEDDEEVEETMADAEIDRTPGGKFDLRNETVVAERR